MFFFSSFFVIFQHCPTFAWVVEKLASYFDMNVQATRLNWYRDSNEWKPFHHDAAAVKPDKVKGTVRKINHLLRNVLLTSTIPLGPNTKYDSGCIVWSRT